jgi:hypothetical protein
LEVSSNHQYIAAGYFD